MRHAVSCVQRECGERTVDVSAHSAREFDSLVQVTGANLLQVARRSLEAMRGFGAAGWTVFLDADVVLFDQAVGRIAAELRAVPEAVDEVRFLLDDHFSGAEIYGVHAHRNANADEILGYVQKQAPAGLKSESHAFKRWRASTGRALHDSLTVVGMHDVEQYYRDIYSKFIVRTLRGGRNAAPPQMRQSATRHETMAARMGVADAPFFRTEGDARRYEVPSSFYRRLGVDERPTLDAGAYSAGPGAWCNP